MREEGWYWVKLITQGREGPTGTPWFPMEWDGKGWWFDEMGRYVEDVHLHSVDENRILNPDEHEQEGEDANE